MYFLISILMFAVLGVTSFLTSTLFEDNLETFFIALGFILSIGSLITIITMCFQQMILKQNFLGVLSHIREKKRKILLAKEHLEEYIRQASETMTKLYPEFEKEIFKSIAPNNGEQLKAYLAQFPDLKFNSVLEVHIGNIRILTKNLYEEKENLESYYNQIRNYLDCKWMLFKPVIKDETLRKEILG